MFKKKTLNLALKYVGIAACGAIAYKKWTETSFQSVNALTNYTKNKYPTSAEYPELNYNRNIMSRHLTEHLYAKLRNKETPNGFTLDEAIQTGVDNVGKYTTPGIVAGDEQSYKVFSDIFDIVIEEKHFGYKKDQEHQTDLDKNKLKLPNNGEFDSKYVLNFRIKTMRNIRGYCFPTFCTRGERRDIETLFVKIFYDHDQKSSNPFKYMGTYYPMSLISDKDEDVFRKNNFWFDRPYTSKDISAYLFRDWPDARGIWMNDESNTSVYLNRKDHFTLVLNENSANLKKAFDSFSDFMNEIENHLKLHNFEFMHNKHLGYLTSSPSNLGTALKLSARLKLPNLVEERRLVALLKKLNLNMNYRLFDENNKSISKNDVTKECILEISSLFTLGKSEVEITELFADSINKLIEIEKKLENGETLDKIV